MNTTESTTEPATKKIKVQKRTPTERQLEALEKARVSKQKKKIETLVKNEIKAKESPFLYPSPYLMGTIGLGLSALVAFYYLKPDQNYQTMQETFYVPPPQSYRPPDHEEPVQMEIVQRQQLTPSQNKTQAFFDNATTI